MYDVINYQSVNKYIIMRQKVDQRAGQLSLQQLSLWLSLLYRRLLLWIRFIFCRNGLWYM